MADVFISYSRRDGAFVLRLQDALKARGREACVDWQDIPPSAEWMAEVRGAIEGGEAVVCVISPDFLESSICRQEVEHAVALQKRLVPIVCRDVTGRDVPEPLAKLNWLFFRDEYT